MSSAGRTNKQLIEFKNFMSPYNRTQSGAFLRSKFVTPSDVLQQKTNLDDIDPTTTMEAQEMCFVQADEKIFAITETSGGSGIITRIDSDSTATAVETVAGLAQVYSQCATYYPDQEYISIIDAAGNYHTYDPNTDTFTEDVVTDGSAGSQSMIFSEIDNTVYWTTDNAIHKDFKGTQTQDIFELPEGIRRNILSIYNNYLVVSQYYRDTETVRVGFWDRDTGNALFDRNILVGNGRLLGAGVVEGRYLVVLGEAVSDNSNYLSKIITYEYDGGS